MQGDRIGVLFVCMGNICRSPLAKALFIHQARELGKLDLFDIDSCGTGGWHAGQGADPRTLMVARAHNVPITHTARQYQADDALRFAHIIAMDKPNLRHLAQLGCPPGRAVLLRSFDAQADHDEVPDPYYGGPEGFELMYAMIDRACRGLLERLTGPDVPSPR